MNTEIAAIPMQKRKPMRDQVRDGVRDLILRGEIKPGERLPSTEKLATLWGTHAPTVHQGLTQLVREGLLERRHGRGTFVRDPERTLNRVAIYLHGPGMSADESASPFRAALLGQLQELLTHEGLSVDLRVDMRGASDKAIPWKALQRAATDRKFQALIVPMCGPDALSWLSRLQVPVAHFGLTQLPSQVVHDQQAFLIDSLNALKGRGCRTVGLINSFSAREITSDTGAWTASPESDRFVELVASMGLRTDEKWLSYTLPTQDVVGLNQARFGRREFHRIWALDERPDGLIVAPDTMAHGVILAMAECRVRCPDDLQLVLQQNARANFLCPYPVTLAVLDERDIAQALLDQVRRQFNGDTCTPEHIRMKLVDNEPDPLSPPY